MTREEFAMARLKKLTPYMSDKEREKLVKEDRSETYRTALLAWDAALAEEYKEIRKWKPFLHWCPDWDFLLIDKGDSEFECCTCFKATNNETK